jgi:hypothetical protein
MIPNLSQNITIKNCACTSQIKVNIFLELKYISQCFVDRINTKQINN